jgi:hypothetical protein
MKHNPQTALLNRTDSADPGQKEFVYMDEFKLEVV